MPRLTRVMIAARARSWLNEGRAMGRAVFSLTPGEREIVILVCALFAIGMAVWALRELLK